LALNNGKGQIFRFEEKFKRQATLAHWVDFRGKETV